MLHKIIILIIAVAILIFAFGIAQEKSAERNMARATYVRAQSQARLDSTAAFLPYVVIGVAVLAGGGLLGMTLIAYTWPDRDKSKTQGQGVPQPIINNHHYHYTTKNIIIVTGMAEGAPMPQTAREVYKLVGHSKPNPDNKLVKAKVPPQPQTRLNDFELNIDT